ncbi:MAG: spore photoproduct lyase family protein, partial [Verrucomicrobiota bacterium]
ANFVLFVNYEDFESALRSAIPQTGRACFFSGYDCDSLAMESITGFAEHFVPFFRNHPEAWFEFRTKSVMTRPLIDREPLPNVIVSYTLSPDKIAREIEHGAPPVAKRIAKIRELTEQGWTVGLRFDPLQPYPGFTELYRELFQQVFTSVASESIHSATLGPMRFPTAMHDKIVKLYPDDPLFARFPTETRNGQVSLPPDLEEHLVAEVTAELEQFMPAEKVFRQTF